MGSLAVVWLWVSLLTSSGLALSTSYQFKNYCTSQRVHKLGWNDLAYVRFDGSKLPSAHCAMAFQSRDNSSNICVVSQPPFTLNTLGPTLSYSQGSMQINRKSYSTLTIVSPTRYCTSGGRYLNIAMDNANTGSTSKNRGYFTLKVTASSKSNPGVHHHSNLKVIVWPTVGGVVFISVVIAVLVFVRRRRRWN